MTKLSESGIVLLQQELCTQYNATFQPAPFSTLIAIALDTFSVPGNWPVNGLRIPVANEETVCWFVWAGPEFSTADDWFKPMHAHHLPDIHPKLVKYLGLPAGWRFLFDDSYEDVWFDEGLLERYKI
ncbi:hypothetical protein [Chitinophaga sp. sic0106]|uniref:immunity protein Imm33 domain-containing protein n=1 Tax=Chitinophaga sp. sic0106 TaxID=2854785 RepID=UPI001C45F16A|nr:hypothetical protein [Chitinophaga sp. sic0106]MBV7530689.1 hypothetical protein [Chitinophaga sp. sic0106]